MNYYFVKNHFLRNKPVIEKIYVQYLTDQKTWKNPQYSDPILNLEIERLNHKLNEKEWVILKKISDQHVQEGPYSTREVFEMLQESVISSQTILWKKGLTRWQRILDIDMFLELFSEKRSSSHADAADLLDSVIEMRRVDANTKVKNSGPEDDNTVFIIHD